MLSMKFSVKDKVHVFAFSKMGLCCIIVFLVYLEVTSNSYGKKGKNGDIKL